MNSDSRYIGRFAPSPTGPLHIGSLIAALASYLDAKANHGAWLLRIENLDPPREMPGANEQIIECLKQHHLNWDGELLWQSDRHAIYQRVMKQLLDQQKAFYCSCSRADIQNSGGIYNGHCRGQRHSADQVCAVRLQVDDQRITFNDQIQGDFSQQLQQQVGDFVIRRKDGLFAYQLAVVIDDALQGVTHVVRGSDLLDSTPRQIFLQQQCGFATPHYSHLPVITNEAGQKLSKQTFAVALNNNLATDNLLKALFFLNQVLPPPSMRQDCQSILHWAIAHWQPSQVSTQLSRQHNVLDSFAC